MDLQISCKEQLSLLPVTALEFCSIADNELLLAGEGPYLKIFSSDGSLLLKEEMLPSRKIHGIRLAPNQVHSNPTCALLLVFGQTGVHTAVIHCEADSLRLERSPKVAEIPDWILDVCWVTFRDLEDFEVVAVMAHNAVFIHRSGTAETSAVFQSEVNCILYSARAQLLGNSINSLVVASGTVFNQILLWHLEGETGSSRVPVRLSLNGHEECINALLIVAKADNATRCGQQTLDVDRLHAINAGVIFSLSFSENLLRLVSVSDDRTIRLWNLPPDWKILEGLQQHTCALVLYGHTSRVWDAQLLPGCVVSIGEDTTCRVWSYQGKCLQVVEGHKGRNVWSLAVSKERKLVATGGGDCGIRVFTLKSAEQNNELAMDVQLPQPHGMPEAGHNKKPDAPRSILLSGKTAICLTSNGCLYTLELDTGAAATLLEQNWVEIFCDPEFAGYSIMALSRCCDPQLLALGNLHGHIKLLSVAHKGHCSVESMWKAHEGKVFSLNWTSSNDALFPALLLSCGPEGIIICWDVKRMEGHPIAIFSLATFVLPPSKHRWVSAALVMQVINSSDKNIHSIVVGDRKGSLHVYRSELVPTSVKDHSTASTGDKFVEPLHSLRGVHGPNGVTCITIHNGSIYTAGRDGYCRQYHLDLDGRLNELTKFKAVKGMDWIERLMFANGDLLVLGFHTTDMIVYSWLQNKYIVRVSCGGGHRSYGFSSQQELLADKKAVAVYIKQSAVCVRMIGIETYFTKPVLQPAFVGREAVSLNILHSDPTRGTGLVAVGSEDCSICLLLLQPLCNPSSCRVVKTLQGHISSVRALSSSPSCHSDCRLLFSGGARASLKVWLVPVGDLESKNGKEVTQESELYLHQDSLGPGRRKGKTKHKDLTSAFPPECRVMALVSFPLSELCIPGMEHSSSPHASALHYVAAGCSDAVIRQYIYDEKERKFYTLTQLTFHGRCILSMEHLIHRTSPLKKQPSTDAGDSISKDKLTAPYCNICAFLFSAATDGKVAVWSLDCTVRKWLGTLGCQLIEGEDSSLKEDSTCAVGRTLSSAGDLTAHEIGTAPNPMISIQVHQSGVNDIAISTIAGADSYYIATVGDDNAVVVIHFSVAISAGLIPKANITVQKQWVEPAAHYSSITGVRFLSSNVLVTTSIDQRIVVWQVKDAVGGNGAATPLKRLACFTHNVADVSSLRVYHTRDGVALILCGIGLQCYFMQRLETVSTIIL